MSINESDRIVPLGTMKTSPHGFNQELVEWRWADGPNGIHRFSMVWADLQERILSIPNSISRRFNYNA